MSAASSSDPSFGATAARIGSVLALSEVCRWEPAEVRARMADLLRRAGATRAQWQQIEEQAGRERRALSRSRHAYCTARSRSLQEDELGRLEEDLRTTGAAAD